MIRFRVSDISRQGRDGCFFLVFLADFFRSFAHDLQRTGYSAVKHNIASKVFYAFVFHKSGNIARFVQYMSYKIFIR